METNSYFNQLKGDLISIGFSFYGEPSSYPADPESTLLKALVFFYEDRKLFRMLLRWILVIAPLIHVERLYKLAEKLDSKFVPVLGALAKKIILNGDRRFKLICEYTKKRMETEKIVIQIPTGYSDSYLKSKYGEDLEFASFGINLAKIEPEDEKKILDLPQILKNHRWLRIRTLVGANFRSDLIFFLTSKAIENPNQAAKILGCSRETAYRLWKEVSLFDGLEKLTA